MPTCSELIDKKKQYQSDIEKILLPNYKSTKATALDWLQSFYKDFGQYSCGSNLQSANATLIVKLTSDSPENEASFLSSDFSSLSLNSSSCKGGSTHCSQSGCVSRINNSINPALNAFIDARHKLYLTKKSLSQTIDDINLSTDCVKLNEQDQSGTNATRNTIIVLVVVAAISGIVIYLWKKYGKK